MRNPDRINRILYHVGLLWHHNPDWRLTQLITNVIGHDGDHFYVEDDYLDRRLRERMRDWGVQLELPLTIVEEALL